MADFLDKNNNTALHMDITPEQASRYIKAGADVNAENYDEKTPIYYAIRRGNLNLVKLLIENGADKPQVYCSNSITDEINRYLVQAGCPASDDIIKKYGTDEQKANIKVTFEEARKNVENKKLYLKQGGDINFKGANGWTLLHYAVSEDKIDDVKFLVENGADQFIKSYKGNVPVIFGSSNCEIYSILKASIDEKDDKGNTRMHNAAICVRYDIVKHLVKLGARFDIVNDDNKTAYDLCDDKSLFKTYEELLNEFVGDRVVESIQILLKRL
jgi:ankyrin repeat protein